MIEREVINCCTARQWYNFPTDSQITEARKKILDNEIKFYLEENKNYNNTKIIHVYLTNKQKQCINLLKQNGFKRAGKINSRIDNHNTILYLYYYIFTGK